MNSNESFELAVVSRQGVPERWVRGFLFVRTPSAQFELGTPREFWARSLLKPFQIVPFLKEVSELTPQQLALAMGSHSGELHHLKVLETRKWDQPTENLILKPSRGLGASTGKPGERGQELWLHPCIGKHQALLEFTAAKGWVRENYTSTDHEYHKSLQSFLESKIKRSKLKWAVDGCGLPTPALTLQEMSLLYESLLTEALLKPLREAMMTYPELVGGSERCDTSLMQQVPQCIAKEGADGLTAIALTTTQGVISIMLKLEAGYDARVSQFILQTLLFHLNTGIRLPSWSPDQNFECTVEIIKKIKSVSMGYGYE